MNRFINYNWQGKTQKQRGAVLVVSLVFLVSLTAVAAALMQNSTSDMKMSGATEEKVIATQDAMSAIDEVIFNQAGPNKTNEFSRPLQGDNYPITDQSLLLPGTKTKATAEVMVSNNVYKVAVKCPHFKLASSVGEFDCNVLQVQVKRNYGRKDKNEVVVNSTVAQVLIGN